VKAGNEFSMTRNQRRPKQQKEIRKKRNNTYENEIS
jgi:hypothetical protein